MIARLFYRLIGVSYEGRTMKLVKQTHHKCLELNLKNNESNICQRTNKGFEVYLVLSQNEVCVQTLMLSGFLLGTEHNRRGCKKNGLVSPSLKVLATQPILTMTLCGIAVTSDAISTFLSQRMDNEEHLGFFLILSMQL